MATKTLKQMDAEAKSLVLSAKEVLDDRDDRTPEEVQGAMKSLEDAEKIVAELEKLTGIDALKTINRLENSLAGLREGNPPHIASSRSAGGDGATLRGGNSHDAIKTAGEMFVESPEFKSWVESVCPNGQAPNSLPGGSPHIEVKTLYTLAADRTASGPLLGQPDRRTNVVPLGWNELTVRSLIANLQTNSDLVEVVREKARTVNAAIVPEATAGSGSSGLKPESALSFEVIQLPVQNIAHHVPATTRVIQDAPRIRGIIDGFLRQGIDQKVEDLVLNSTDSNFKGINQTANILTQSYSTDYLTTVRKAVTKVRFTGFAVPNGIVMNPSKWEEVDLLQDSEDRYYYGGPMALGVPRLWGLPVAQSNYQSDSTTLLGDFRQAVFYDRLTTQIFVGTINDDFVRNLVRILAEMRAAFHVQRPSSFISIAHSS